MQREWAQLLRSLLKGVSKVSFKFLRVRGCKTKPNGLALPSSWSDHSESLQFRVLRFGLLQDGYVGVGVSPEGEEILICLAGFCSVALQSEGASAA